MWLVVSSVLRGPRRRRGNPRGEGHASGRRRGRRLARGYRVRFRRGRASVSRSVVRGRRGPIWDQLSLSGLLGGGSTL